jgi:hypothetical protein
VGGGIDPRRELVPKRDDFQVQRGRPPDDKSDRVEQRNNDGRHDVRLSENACNLNRRNTYRVLDSHRMSVSGRTIVTDLAPVGEVREQDECD